jgi:hypothetical protein
MVRMDKGVRSGQEGTAGHRAASRREFIREVGIALAALMTMRCRLPSRLPHSPRDRARDCWLRLDWLAEETQNAKRLEQGQDARDQLLQDHQSALDELTASGELESDVADQVHTAFDAAIQHIWRSNAPITCYEAVMIDYKPTSSNQLANQAKLLAQGDDLDPETVAMAEAAIARDVAFLNMSGTDLQTLYDSLLKQAEEGSRVPSFDELDLTVSSEALEAARFLVELLLEE